MIRVVTVLLMLTLAAGGTARAQAGDTPSPRAAAEQAAGKPAGVPEAFSLYQNYPNPFHDETVIRYALRAPGRVLLTVYDLLGREVARLLDAELPAGEHTTRWDGTDERGAAVPSGMYLYRLQVGPESAVRTMILLR